MNEIVKFKSDSGREITITPNDVRQLICPNANGKEVALFLAHCQAHRLDPFTREAYLIKYGDAPASIVTNYNVFNARAQQFPDYDGIEDGVVIATGKGEIVHREGSAVYPQLGETLLGGWARVYRKDKRPTYVELALSDYTTGRAKWKTSPGLMIDKCAKSAAWRTAYPSEFSGMYSSEEMDQAQLGTVRDDEPIQAGAVSVEPGPDEAPAQAAPEANGDPLQAVRDLFPAYREATGYDAQTAMALIEEYVGKPSMQDFTEEDCRVAEGYMRDVIETAAGREADGE